MNDQGIVEKLLNQYDVFNALRQYHIYEEFDVTLIDIVDKVMLKNARLRILNSIKQIRQRVFMEVLNYSELWLVSKLNTTICDNDVTWNGSAHISIIPCNCNYGIESAINLEFEEFSTDIKATTQYYIKSGLVSDAYVTMQSIQEFNDKVKCAIDKVIGITKTMIKKEWLKPYKDMMKWLNSIYLLLL